MKFRTDKDILRFFGISLGMILLGTIISLFIQSIFFIGAGLILGGLVLLITGLYASTKPKGYFIPDERVTKNTDKAGHHAFWIVMVTIIILGLFEIVIPGTIIFKDASVVILYMGIYSFILFRWFYNKKGDLE
jgi:hypothetical protein